MAEVGKWQHCMCNGQDLFNRIGWSQKAQDFQEVDGKPNLTGIGEYQPVQAVVYLLR